MNLLIYFRGTIFCPFVNNISLLRNNIEIQHSQNNIKEGDETQLNQYEKGNINLYVDKDDLANVPNIESL